MRLKLQYAPYIANKIARDIANAPFIKLDTTLENLSKNIAEVLSENIQIELDINEKVRVLLEQHNDEIESYRMDEHQIFRMFKRQLAEEKNFPLRTDERYSDIAHSVLKRITQKDYISFQTSEMIIKNIIYKSLNDYAKTYEKIEEDVLTRLAKYKSKVVYGSDEYNIIFSKLYEDELRKRGLL